MRIDYTRFNAHSRVHGPRAHPATSSKREHFALSYRPTHPPAPSTLRVPARSIVVVDSDEEVSNCVLFSVLSGTVQRLLVVARCFNFPKRLQVHVLRAALRRRRLLRFLAHSDSRARCSGILLMLSGWCAAHQLCLHGRDGTGTHARTLQRQRRRRRRSVPVCNR